MTADVWPQEDQAETTLTVEEGVRDRIVAVTEKSGLIGLKPPASAAGFFVLAHQKAERVSVAAGFLVLFAQADDTHSM